MQNYAFASGQLWGGHNAAQQGVKMFVDSYRKGVAANAGNRFQTSSNPLL